MELQEIPAPVPESEPTNLEDQDLENQEMDRIAFELWQRGSLPEVAAASEADVEDVASHESCL